jgi:hypothetical protein
MRARARLERARGSCRVGCEPGVETERGFEIHGVNGIAERKTHVNNNAFVNMSARLH